MNKIAAAILSVGLCFYQVYRKKTLVGLGGHDVDYDSFASIIAVVAALYVIL
jgi:hypothetical protein